MSMQDHEIAIIIEFTVPSEKRARFLELLGENCRDTLQDDGCLRMEISEPFTGDGQTVFLTERWSNQAAIDQHRAKPGHDASHVRVDELVARKRVAKCAIISG